MWGMVSSILQISRAFPSAATDAGLIATRCLSRVVNPHTPKTRFSVTIGDEIARSEWGRPKTESSHNFLPVFG